MDNVDFYGDLKTNGISHEYLFKLKEILDEHSKDISEQKLRFLKRLILIIEKRLRRLSPFEINL